MTKGLNVYEKSNSVETFHLTRLDKKQTAKLLACDTSVSSRLKAADDLLKYLCSRCHIANVRLCVHDTPRPASKARETHGYYQVKGLDRSIHIYNLTAKRKQPISIKQFLGTLLHEFMHHYDLAYLRLTDTLHTTGFYKRIYDLQDKLTK